MTSGESRWSIAHELKTMRDIVDGLPDLVVTTFANAKQDIFIFNGGTGFSF